MKKLWIILLVAGLASCNSGQNADGTSGASASSDTSTNAADGSDASNREIVPTTATSIDTSVSNFITQAVMGNALEVEASEVAQKKSKNSEVQSFAGMMITDHGKALDKLETLAKKKRVELPMMVDATRNWSATESSATKSTQDAAEKYGSQSRPGNDVVSHDQGGETTSGQTSKAGAGSQKGANSQTTSPANAMYATHQEKLNRLKQRTGIDFDREYMKMMVEGHAKAMTLLNKGLQNSDQDIKAFSKEMLPTIQTHEGSTKLLFKKIQLQK